MNLTPIAYAHNGFVDKFGIPRQSRPDSVLRTRIVFAEGYRDANMLRGIEGFSHLWLIWGFDTDTWSPTVRPPRLGGNERVGVLATRSPFRPNPLGLTSVELIKVVDGELIVRGADLKDGTAIYDIKPYLSLTDSHPDARNGFAEAHWEEKLKVEYAALSEGRVRLKEGEWREIKEILEQDPRPAYQDDPERIYKLDYADWHIEFQVDGTTLTVLSLTTNH